jgi:hypothetical protein
MNAKSYEIILIAQIASSITLLFLGSFHGRMQIYTYESLFWSDLMGKGGSLEMLSLFSKYIGIFKS